MSRVVFSSFVLIRRFSCTFSSIFRRTLGRHSACAFLLLCSSFVSANQNGFDRPPHIAEAVDFWSRVYSEIDTLSGFIHDKRQPSLVYELYPLDAGDKPKRQQRDIDKRVRHYRRLINDMVGRPSHEFSLEQQRIHALFDTPMSADALRAAAKRVRFQRGQSDRFQQGVRRQAKLGGLVERVLAEHGLPQELAAIPHVESSYNPKVKSHAGALGLWQIMPSTGRRYLKISDGIDERLDIEKSTQAAARLLKHNYSVTQSWPLAVTAYNRGLAGVRRAVSATGSRDIGVIARTYEGRSFGFASRNFYPAFLAAFDVSTGRFPLKPDTPAAQSLTLKRYLSVKAVEQAFGVPTLRLKQLNPQLGIRVWNGEQLLSPNYSLQLPLDEDLAAAGQTLRNLEALHGVDTQLGDRFYRIQKGDNLVLLAESLNMRTAELRRLNGVDRSHRIYAGKILRLQGEDPSRNERPVDRRLASLQTPSSDNSAVPAQQQQVGRMIRSVMPTSSGQALVAQYAYEAMQLSRLSPWGASLASTDRGVPVIRAAALSVPQQTQEPIMVPDYALASLQADPADYLVAGDKSIEIQVGETLGHYADWAQVSSLALGQLNGLRSGQRLVVGKRLRLPSELDGEEFEQHRRSYHASLQENYFANFQIAGTHQHALSGGDSLWDLANDEYHIPLWLLRQYNPDLDFASVLALNQPLLIPLVTSKT